MAGAAARVTGYIVATRQSTGKRTSGRPRWWGQQCARHPQRACDEGSVMRRRAAAYHDDGAASWDSVPAPVRRLSEEIVVLMRFGLKAAEVAYEAEAFADELGYEPLSAPPGLEIDDLVRKAANSILGKPTRYDGSKLMQARRWLLRALRDRAEHPVAKLRPRAEAAGHRWSTVLSAKRGLRGHVVHRAGGRGHPNRWMQRSVAIEAGYDLSGQPLLPPEPFDPAKRSAWKRASPARRGPRMLIGAVERRAAAPSRAADAAPDSCDSWTRNTREPVTRNTGHTGSDVSSNPVRCEAWEPPPGTRAFVAGGIRGGVSGGGGRAADRVVEVQIDARYN